jgi:hypothetical protein
MWKSSIKTIILLPSLKEFVTVLAKILLQGNACIYRKESLACYYTEAGIISKPKSCTMKRISFWASKNKTLTRIFFILAYIPLNILGLCLGNLLAESNLSFGPGYIYSVFLLIIATVFLYNNQFNYYKRKLADFSLGLLTFAGICYYGNHINNSNPVFPFSGSTVAISLSNHSNLTEIKVLNPSKEKLSKKEFKTLRKNIRKQKHDASGTNVLLIVLTILVALGLLYLLAALSCTIACNGSEALAWIVLLLGAFGIAFLTFRIIRRINKGPRNPRIKKEETVSIP